MLEAGRSIGDADEALRIEQGQVVGQGPAYRIGRFGAPGNAAGYLASASRSLCRSGRRSAV